MLKKFLSKLSQVMGVQRSSSTSKQNVQLGSHRSTSLRKLKSFSIVNNQIVTNIDGSYSSWLEKHPSALSSFDQMMKEAEGKKIVVFLDYDGTLSPVVDNPDHAFMSDEMRAAVQEVAKYFPTAIISGRSRDKVKDFVQLSDLYYAGSHGMDILAPPRQVKTCDGKNNPFAIDKKRNEVLFQPAKKFRPAIQNLLVALKQKIMKIQGARIEDNLFCISVHFRHVRDEDYGLLVEKVKSVLENHPEFHLSWGKKVMEIRPEIKWNKGHALEYLLDALGLSNSHDVLPLYIGDDQTDEDAFKVIKRKGQGYSIIVTSCARDTKASYSLHDPSQVLTFLSRLARWRKSSSSSRSLAQIWDAARN